MVLNLTAVDATEQTYLTVFPTGMPRPVASDLNPRPGRVFANQILAKLGPDGSISVYNDAGTVDLLIDVAATIPSAQQAADDAATITQDSAATSIDVLANDTSTDGSPLVVRSASQPSHGTVAITGGGSGLTYRPAPGYCNAPPATTLDQFTYTLTNGTSATVYVTVPCLDLAPVAVADAATVVEDAAATPVPVLANDTDVDGGPKSIDAVTQPANGTAAITGGGTGLTYRPAADFCNTPPGTTLDTFTYRLNGGSSAVVTMTVTCVDDPPVAVDDTATVDRGRRRHCGAGARQRHRRRRRPEVDRVRDAAS